jgi:phage replication O-like protein O
MPKRRESPEDQPFEGFRSPNFTIVPDELFDQLLAKLSGAELKVLLYIVRRTFGFKKDSDEISLNQICTGIQTRDGRTLDQGTGLSQSTVLTAIKGLLEKNIILAQRRMSQEKGNEPTLYRLNVIDPFPENRGRGGPKIGEALPRKSGTQYTVEQDTVRQETEISNSLEGSTLHNATLQTFSKKKVENLNFSASEENEQIDDSKNDGGEYQPQTPSSNGLRSIGQVLTSRKLPPKRSKTAEDSAYSPQSAPTNRGRPPKAPEWLARLVRDTSEQLHDHYHIEQNIGQAARLWKQTGYEDQRFQSKWSEAKQITQGYTVDKACEEHPTLLNRMPYLYKVLRDLLGLKDVPISDAPKTSSRAKEVNEQAISPPDPSSHSSSSRAQLEAKVNSLRTRTPS